MSDKLGRLIDAAFAADDAYRRAQDKADDLKNKLDAIKAELLEALIAEKLDASATKLGKAAIRREFVPSVNDWGKVYAFIKKHDAFELLQKRMTATAWRERYENDELVPGTEAFQNVSVRLSRTKS